MPLHCLLRPFAALGLTILPVTLALAGDPVFPPSSRFGFEVPSDMVASKRFLGFERAGGGGLVSVVELPGEAYKEIERSFTIDGLKAQGFALESQTDLKIDGDKDAVLYTGGLPPTDAEGKPIELPPGVSTIRKWILLVAGGDVTGIIVAQMTPDAESEATVRKMLTSVRIRPALSLNEQVEALPFRLTDLAGFHPVRVLAGNSLLLTRGDKDQPKNFEQPVLVMAQAVQQPPAADQRDSFARTALYANQTLKDFRIERAQSYRQNGVDWHEIVARATDEPSGTDVVVSQTIRFNPDGYVRALGVVKADQRGEELGQIRRVVDSLQLK